MNQMQVFQEQEQLLAKLMGLNQIITVLLKI